MANQFKAVLNAYVNDESMIESLGEIHFLAVSILDPISPRVYRDSLGSPLIFEVLKDGKREACPSTSNDFIDPSPMVWSHCMYILKKEIS